MTRLDTLPIARAVPHVPGLQATLKHSSGRAILSITDSPQTVELEFTNRTPYEITADPGLVRLIFRRGVLTETDEIALAPQSEAQWVLSVDTIDNQDIALSIAGVGSFALTPGDSKAIRLTGINAAPAGGSRSTRVQFEFSAFYHTVFESNDPPDVPVRSNVILAEDNDDPFADAEDDQVDDRIELLGSRLIHLAILRWHEPGTLELRDIKSGSVAVSGPFTAGFDGQGGVLNDGKSLNELTLRIVNTSNKAVELVADGDAASRLHLSFRQGNRDVKWGLIAEHGDHLLVGQPLPDGWQLDHHTLRRTRPGVLKPNQSLLLKLKIFSAAPSGQTELILTYRNIDGIDDGDLILPLTLGAMAEVNESLHISKPVELHGDNAALKFVVAEEGKTTPSKVSPVLSVSRDGGEAGQLKIQASVGVSIENPAQLHSLRVQNVTNLMGPLTVNAESHFNQKVTIDGVLNVKSWIDVEGPVISSGYLIAGGEATFNGGAIINRGAQIGSGLTVTGGGASIRGTAVLHNGLSFGDSGASIKARTNGVMILNAPARTSIDFKIANRMQMKISTDGLTMGRTTLTEADIKVLKKLANGSLEVLIKSYRGYVLDNYNGEVNDGDKNRTVQFQRLGSGGINKAWKMKLVIVD